MNLRTYRVIIEPDTKVYLAYVPALTGCQTWGKTVKEAQKHIEEAIQVYLETLVEYGDPIPNEAGFESFHTVTIPTNIVSKRSRKKQQTQQYA